MNQKLHRIFLGSIKPRRSNDEALKLGLVYCGEPEGFHLRHFKLVEKAIVQMSDLDRLVCRQCSSLARRIAALSKNDLSHIVIALCEIGDNNL